MAVDQTEIQGQEAPQVESQEVAAGRGAASASDSGQEQGGIGDFIRNLFAGRRGAAPSDEPVSGAETPEEPVPEATTAPQTDPEAVRREAQRIADQEIARREWTRATQAAERGDTSLLREMAERGHGPAQRELAKRGEHYELGEARAKELEAQAEHEALGGSLAQVAQVFDTATIAPILSVLPEAAKKEANEAFTKAGGGIDGREAFVRTALKALQKSVREASDDDVLKRIDQDDVFRKKVMAKVRGLPEYDEPDLVGAVSGTGAVDGDAFLRGLLK